MQTFNLTFSSIVVVNQIFNEVKDALDMNDKPGEV